MVQIPQGSYGISLRSFICKYLLAFHKTDWLNICPTTFKPLLYRRCVDDSFLLFHFADHVPQFLSFLNSQHLNFKFTCEVEYNSTLPFLDISITRKTSAYQKPTFMYRSFYEFHSFIPFQYKRCLSSSPLYRFFSVCSSYENFHVQLELFRKVFNRNGYPTRLFDRCVRVFLDKVFQPKAVVHSVPKKVMYFCLPFTGSHFLQIRTQILDFVLLGPVVQRWVSANPGLKFNLLFQSEYFCTSVYFKTSEK